MYCITIGITVCTSLGIKAKDLSGSETNRIMFWTPERQAQTKCHNKKIFITVKRTDKVQAEIAGHKRPGGGGGETCINMHKTKRERL